MRQSFHSFAPRRLARRLLATPALAIALATGLLTAPSAPARAETTHLEVAYIPILAMAQLFVMQQEGWLKQADLDLKMTRFSSGPAMVQALASSKFDVAYIGIGPAMVARAHGVDLKILANNTAGQGGLLGRGDFATAFSKGANAAQVFASYHKRQGRPVKLATLPKGSVPDTLMRYYLFEVAKVAPADVEILGMGAEQMQQALLSGAVDGASVLDPIPAIVASRDKTARVVVTGDEMLPNAPGAVLAASERVVAAHPAAVRKLVMLHIRATELIHKDPARAARDIASVIGQGLVPTAVIETSLRASLDTYNADPHRLLEPAARLQDYQISIGSLAKAVDLKALIDPTIYDQVRKAE